MPILIWFILLADVLLGRKPVQRAPDAQAAVDRETAALRLYHFEACPYCRRTRRDVRMLGLKIGSADIKRDAAAFQELVKGGGKKQVPCLRIEEAGGARWLYESADIARYLQHFI